MGLIAASSIPHARGLSVWFSDPVVVLPLCEVQKVQEVQEVQEGMVSRPFCTSCTFCTAEKLRIDLPTTD
jgi:hypothetical protein